MPNLTKILGGSIGEAGAKLINSLGDQVDRFVTTKEDAKKLKQEMARTVQKHELDMEEELSARHKADMTSDSWLSKNIRPMMLLALFFLLLSFAFADGNIGSFEIKPQYISLFRALSISAFSFYFGSRGVEKGMSLWKKSKERTKQLSEEQKKAITHLLQEPNK